MKVTICLRDFNIMSNTVDLLMKDKTPVEQRNSGITLEYEPHSSGYQLFVSVDSCISGVYGTFRTEIVGEQ